MLSQKAFDRFSIMLFLFTTLCLIPCDWDMHRRRLRPTKYTLRLCLNRFFMALMVGCFLYFGVMLSLDIKGGILTFDQLIITYLLFIMMLLMVALAQCICFFDDFLVISINTLFATNKHFYRTILTQSERKELEVRRSPTVQVSNVLEIFAMVHSMCITSMFIEENDPFRRYCFDIAAYLFDLSSLYEIPFMFMYFCGVRIIYGFFLLICFYFTAYQESMIFWLEQVVHNERILAQPLKYKEQAKIVFVSMTFLNRIFITSEGLSYLFPFLLTGSFLSLILSNYATLRLYGKVNLATYLFLPSYSVLLSVYIKMWSDKAGQFETLSTEFVRVWSLKLRHSRCYSRFLKACRPIFVPVHHFFHLNLDVYLQFQQFASDKTIELLLSTK